jgi:hypothetical protein
MPGQRLLQSTVHTDRIVDGGRTLEVARVKVNDAGRQALAD